MKKEEEESQPKGAFVSSLVRTNKDIKRDRAASITEDAEMIYRRAIENMEMDLKRLKRERENMLDLSPSNKMMIIQAGEFDAEKFTQEDLTLGIKIRNLKIKIAEAKDRYEYLFGQDSSDAPASSTPTLADDGGTIGE